MLAPLRDRETIQILKYLENIECFDRIQAAYPPLDLYVAKDLLYDYLCTPNEEQFEAYSETKNFLNTVIEKDKVAKSKKPTHAFNDNQSQERNSLLRTATKISSKIGVFATKTVVQHAPNATIAAAVAAAMIGNNPEAEPTPIAPLCDDASLTICDDTALIQSLTEHEQNTVRAMIATTESKAEKKAINAIAVASAKTGVDLNVLLVVAHLESSIGKNTSVSTSSAQGTYQYVEQTWLESLKKHESKLPQDIQNLTQHIYKKGYEYHVDDKALEKRILDLRNGDPLLHAEVAALDMMDKDGVVLKSEYEDTTAENPHADILSLAQSLRMGKVAEFMVNFYQEITNDIQAKPKLAQDQDYLKNKTEQLINFTTEQIYMPHFMGKRGSSNFLKAYHNEDLREAPVRALVNTHNQALSSRQIKANKELFENGRLSTAQIYDIIRAKVEYGFTGIIDKRVAQNNTIEQFKTKIDFSSLKNVPIPS